MTDLKDYAQSMIVALEEYRLFGARPLGRIGSHLYV